MRSPRLLLLLTLVVTLDVGAMNPGDVLYVRTKGAPVLQKADPLARVLERLDAGTEVVWLGREGLTQFHRIRVDGMNGFVRQMDLTPAKPQVELYEAPDAGEREPLFRPGVVLQPMVHHYTADAAAWRRDGG
jgi:hypothetical protein